MAFASMLVAGHGYIQEFLIISPKDFTLMGENTAPTKSPRSSPVQLMYSSSQDCSVHPDISPQQIDGSRCGLSAFMVANCLSLDLKLDLSKSQGHFGCCREEMALRGLETKDDKQFNPFPCTDKEDKSCTEEEDNQLAHPLELKSL